MPQTADTENPTTMSQIHRIPEMSAPASMSFDVDGSPTQRVR